MPQDSPAAALPAATGMAVFYDGTSSRKHRVVLRLGPAALEIFEAGLLLGIWPYADVRRADGDGALRLQCVSGPSLARLDVTDPATAIDLRARCTALDSADGSRQTWRIVGWSLAAAVSIVLMTVYGVPLVAARMVPLIPVALEQRLGDAVDKQLGAMLQSDVCENPDGQRAFSKLMDKLREGSATTVRIDAKVISSRIPNAVALPGGRVYLFDGLLKKANDVDEVAGVLAHEIGHAQHRDGLRQLLQTGGTSFLIGLLFGDITGGGAIILASRALLQASHSREAETAADDYAISTLNRLNRSPAPMGELLVRITGSHTRGSILDSHPVSADRLERMKKSAPAVLGAPILTEAEWQALKRICPPKPEKDKDDKDTNPGGAMPPELSGRS